MSSASYDVCEHVRCELALGERIQKQDLEFLHIKAEKESGSSVDFFHCKAAIYFYTCIQQLKHFCSLNQLYDTVLSVLGGSSFS